MKIVEKAAAWLSQIAAGIAAVLMAIMMVLVSLDVFMKYFLNAPIPMTLELVAAYFMPAIVFLPLGAITQGGHHLEVELFTQWMAPKTLAFVKLVGIVVGVIYFSLLLTENFAQAIEMTRRGEYWQTATMPLPVWIARWFLPLACLLTLLWLFLQGINLAVFGLTGRNILSTHNAPRLAATSVSAG